VTIKEFEELLFKNEILCPWTEVAFRRSKELTNNFINFNF
jgi:hypothetical protein